jgi:hypothetical protein
MFLGFLQRKGLDYLRIAYHREGVTPKWRSKCPVEIEKPLGGILSFFFLFLFIYLFSI